MNMMNTTEIERALKRLGEVLESFVDVEVLLVGGAAGMLTGVFPASRTTVDCDVMVYTPPEAMARVEIAADVVQAELNLPEGWFNSKVQIRLDALPDGWQKRRIWVCDSGKLRVWAASRLDLIAMKVIAGRARDIEDIESMRIRSDEAEYVRTFLDGLASKGTPKDQIERARSLLGTLRTHG